MRDVYDGPQGALLATCSMLSLHTPLGAPAVPRAQVRSSRGPEDSGRRKRGGPDRQNTSSSIPTRRPRLLCSDLSHEMLRRARHRLKSDRPRFVVADLTRLPFADSSFDCVTCGYVLEHLPDARLGLAELSRVMTPGARMLLLTTEGHLFGRLDESDVVLPNVQSSGTGQKSAKRSGLAWHRELWFTRMHKALRAGGICVELVKG